MDTLDVQHGILCVDNNTDIITLSRVLKVDNTIHSIRIQVSLGTEFCNSRLVALAESLKWNNTVTIFTVTYTPVDNAGIAAIADALKVNKTLCRLQLSFNWLGNVGVSILANGLQVNTTLHSLAIKQNQIDHMGALTLSRALCNLRVLNLWDNPIGDDGAVALANALKINTKLRALYLGGCRIGDVGAAALAEMLTVNTALQILHLTNNRIARNGILALSDALKVNSTLKNVALEYNILNGFGDRILVNIPAGVPKLFSSNASLEQFDLCPNSEWLHRNRRGKVRAHKSAAAMYKVCRLRLGMCRDICRLVGRYVASSRGQLCWCKQ